jgi:hypothetical protein
MYQLAGVQWTCYKRGGLIQYNQSGITCMLKPSTGHLACDTSACLKQGLDQIFCSAHFGAMITHKGFDSTYEQNCKSEEIAMLMCAE